MSKMVLEEGPFPYHLIEVLNGVLAVVLFWMLIFLIMHLYNLWADVHSKYYGHRGWLRAIRRIYSDYKPEIALLVIVTAFCVRTFILWYVRWFKHELDRDDLITLNAGEILIAMTGALVIGVMCWIRVISPLAGRKAVLIWIMMALSSVAFGVGMHYLF